MENLFIFIWLNAFVIYIMSFLLYRHSRIKYSAKKVFDLYNIKISYNQWFMFLTLIIIILNIVMIHYTSIIYMIYPSFTKYWYYLAPISGLIALNIMRPKEIIDDGSFKTQPRLMKRKNFRSTSNLLILLLVISIIIEIVNGPYFKYYQDKKIGYMGMSRILTLILVIYVSQKEKNMSNCKYKLPKNWQ